MQRAVAAEMLRLHNDDQAAARAAASDFRQHVVVEVGCQHLDEIERVSAQVMVLADRQAADVRIEKVAHVERAQFRTRRASKASLGSMAMPRPASTNALTTSTSMPAITKGN